MCVNGRETEKRSGAARLQGAEVEKVHGFKYSGSIVQIGGGVVKR